MISVYFICLPLNNCSPMSFFIFIFIFIIQLSSYVVTIIDIHEAVIEIEDTDAALPQSGFMLSCAWLH